MVFARAHEVRLLDEAAIADRDRTQRTRGFHGKNARHGLHDHCGKVVQDNIVP